MRPTRQPHEPFATNLRVARLAATGPSAGLDSFGGAPRAPSKLYLLRMPARSSLPSPPTGVLYVNLGSPAAPTTAAVRAFLDEFLGDPLVVDANRVLWSLLRKLLILPLRAPKSAALYRSIWSAEGSPLVAFSRRFAAGLARELGAEFRVEVAMRYGAPSIASALTGLVRAGCERIVLLSAFPQASRTTTGTIELAVARALAAHAPPPELVKVGPYHTDPGYVAALAAAVRAADAPDAHLVLSFHGLPVRYVEAGDPYRDHCEATARALAAELGREPRAWTLAYQSRFGREPWLGPDVAEVAPRLASGGQRVLVAAPSFTTDCLETLEELGLRLRASCTARGGEFVLVPSLNERPAWIAAAAALVRSATP